MGDQKFNRAWLDDIMVEVLRRLDGRDTITFNHLVVAPTAFRGFDEHNERVAHVLEPPKLVHATDEPWFTSSLVFRKRLDAVSLYDSFMISTARLPFLLPFINVNYLKEWYLMEAA